MHQLRVDFEPHQIWWAAMYNIHYQQLFHLFL